MIQEKCVESSATDTASANVSSDTAQHGGKPTGNASNQTNGLKQSASTDLNGTYLFKIPPVPDLVPTQGRKCFKKTDPIFDPESSDVWDLSQEQSRRPEGDLADLNSEENYSPADAGAQGTTPKYTNAGIDGIEPTTNGLTGHCSTTELYSLGAANGPRTHDLRSHIPAL